MSRWRARGQGCMLWLSMQDRESTRYSQRALFFALLVSCLQPAISQCPLGMTGPSGVCSNCVPGKYKTVTGSSACLECCLGKYSTTTAATTTATCQNCLAGTFQFNTGRTVCTKCELGYFSSIIGSTSNSCQLCIAGKVAPNTGTGSCASCEAGKYYQFTGGRNCLLCDAGKYNSNTGSTHVSEMTFRGLEIWDLGIMTRVGVRKLMARSMRREASSLHASGRSSALITWLPQGRERRSSLCSFGRKL
jgi:hypothetical protein